MLSATLSVLLASASLPPYLATNKGTLRVETPSGQIITIPENSTFLVNLHETRLDNREMVLDNVLVFRDSYE